MRNYLNDYQQTSGATKVTVDNIRRILSSFFSWLEDEDYIVKSPVRRIHKVKVGKTVKETYSDEALEQMRDHCEGIRDLALIDLLASTGMRVGELVKLNRNDIDFENRECIVTGKGDKQRRVYFDARTKIHLQRYLAERIDDNPALFVSLLAPYDRLQISGVEIRLRRLGRELNIPKVHPHKFRRTLATMAIDKGMPIEQVQHLLGHQSLDTTLQYAMVNQTNVKNVSPQIYWLVCRNLSRCLEVSVKIHHGLMSLLLRMEKLILKNIRKKVLIQFVVVVVLCVMVKRNYVMEILRFLAEKEISTIQSSWNQVTG